MRRYFDGRIRRVVESLGRGRSRLDCGHVYMNNSGERAPAKKKTLQTVRYVVCQYEDCSQFATVAPEASE